MFDADYFASGASHDRGDGAAASINEGDGEYDKYRSSGDTNHDDRVSASGGKQQQQQQLIDATIGAMISETPGYEGVPTEDAVVSSLATRQWARNQLAGPREDFRRTNYGANGRGQLHPQQPPPPLVAPAALLSSQTDALAPQSDGREPATDAHNPAADTTADYYERDDGSINELRPNVSRLALQQLAKPYDSNSGPRQPSAPSPFYTPRTGGGRTGTTPRTSRHTNVNGSSIHRSAEQRDYSQVRSVLADYMSGNLSYLEARHGAARANSPSHQGKDSNSESTAPTPRRTLTERDLPARTSSPAPRAPSRRQPTPQGITRTLSHGGAPRCASIIPEHRKYVPPEEQPPQPTREEKEAAAAAKEAEEREELERARRVARVAAKRVASRTGSARGRPRTPISYREGDVPPQQKKRGSARKSRTRSVSAQASRGTANATNSARTVPNVAGEEGAGGAVGSTPPALRRPDASPAGDAGKARQATTSLHQINPFGYRKRLVFPTNAPTVTLSEPPKLDSPRLIIKKRPGSR